jgi:CRP/FNR family transcriptional regulator, cyclic AMP receptor protein
VATMLENLFGNINDPSVQKVLRSLDMIQDAEVKAGEYIFREGDKSTEFYIIGLGAVEILKKLDEEGKEKVLDTLGSGNFFGEGAIFTDTPRSASVRALSNCRLFKIDKRQFFELLKNNNDIAVTFLSNMLSVVNQRLHHANRELVVLYEVSRIIAEEAKNLPELASKILYQLVGITSDEKAAFLLIDEVGKDRVVAEIGFNSKEINFDEFFEPYDENFEGVKNAFKDEKTHSKVIGKYLILGIKNLEGKLSGLIVLFDKEGEFKEDDIRLSVSISEQLGHVVENFAGKEAAEGKDKLNKEFLSF